MSVSVFCFKEQNKTEAHMTLSYSPQIAVLLFLIYRAVHILTRMFSLLHEEVGFLPILQFGKEWQNSRL